MLKKLFFGAILLGSLTGCGKKAAFNYSEDFVKKEESLRPDIEKAEASVESYVQKQQYDSIAVVGARIEKLVDSKLNEIMAKPAPDVKEGDNFKRAGIKYFEFIKSMYTCYKDYGNAGTEEARNQVLVRLSDIIKNRETAVADIKRAQQKFADANGFKVK